MGRQGAVLTNVTFNNCSYDCFSANKDIDRGSRFPFDRAPFSHRRLSDAGHQEHIPLRWIV